MDTTILVMFPRSEGEQLLEALDRHHFDVRAAFWLYQSETDTWRLVIASPIVDQFGPREGYERVQAALKEMNQPFGISLNDITVVGQNDVVVRNLRKKLHIQKGEQGVLLRRTAIGDVYIDEAYVYRIL